MSQPSNMSGQSPEQQVYTQYIQTYNAINQEMHKIDNQYIGGVQSAYPAGTAPQNVQDDITQLGALHQTLTSLQNTLGKLYQHASSSESSATDFLESCDSIQSQIADIGTQAQQYYQDALGTPSTSSSSPATTPSTPPTNQVSATTAQSTIYNQYLSAYNNINQTIKAIDALYPAGTAPQSVQADRASLVQLLQSNNPNSLFAAYQEAYKKAGGDPKGGLDGFNSYIDELNDQVSSTYTDAKAATSSKPVTPPPVVPTSPTSPSSPTAPKTTVHAAQTSIYNQYIAAYNLINQNISAIDSLYPAGTAPQSVQTDRADLVSLLQTSSPNSLYAVYQNAYQAASKDPQHSLDQFNSYISQLDVQVSNTYADAKAAVPITPVVPVKPPVTPPITPIQPVTPVQPVTPPTNIGDNTPLPNPSQVVQGVWYTNWTTQNLGPYNPNGNPPVTFPPIPQGVNTVNLFVGALDPTTGVTGLQGAFSEPTVLQAFVQACHAQGISVMVSVGGHGGAYDSTWNQLNASNVSDYAGSLTKFCQQYGVDGIDFDWEPSSFDSGPQAAANDPTTVAQAKLVGELIANFKNDSGLQASLCTNSGNAWQSIEDNVYAAAKLSDGKSAIDHLNIMAYFPYDNFEDNFLTGTLPKGQMNWMQWAQSQGLSSSQITVGMLSSASDLSTFTTANAKVGFGSSLWFWDPANANTSNKASASVNKIYSGS